MQSRDPLTVEPQARHGARSTQRVWRLLGLALLVVLPLGGVARLAAAPIGAQAIIATDPSDSLRPQVAVDGQNNLHVVWHEGEGAANQAVKYIKGTVSGGGYSWSAPIDVYKPGGASTYIYPRIAVDSQNQVHIAFTFGGDVFYKRWPATGTPDQGTAAAKIGSGIYPSIATDANNHVHVVWEQSVDGNFEIIYRESNGATFGAEQNLSRNSGDSLNPDLAVDTGGSVHVVWYDKSSGIRIQYAERVGGTWRPNQIFDGNESYFPSIAADRKGCVHIAWAQVSTTSAMYRKYCNHQLVDNRAAGTGVSAPQAAVGASATGQAVVTWNSKLAGIDNIYYSVVDNGNVTPQARLQAGGRQFWPDVAGLNNGQVAVVWQEAGSARFDPAFTMLTVGPPPPTITGALQLNGGAAYTNQPQVTATVSNTSTNAVPTAYGLAEDAAPASVATAFSNPTTSTGFTLNTADGQCRTHRVYGKLANADGQSAPFYDDIMYDPSVAAMVLARNPDLPTNPVLNDFGSLEVPSGAVAYTRRTYFNLGVGDSPSECSGLAQYALTQHDVAPDAGAWHAIPAEGYVSRQVNFTPDLATNGGQGAYQFDVYATDKAGNSTAAPYVATVVYDNTSPTVSDPGALPTTASPKGGMATITTSGLTVDDNLYPDQGGGRKYWGYWVAVKATGAGAPTDDEWNIYGTVRAGAVPQTLSWQIAYGLVGGVPSFTPGSHTVYIRFLDGAGNASSALASQPIQVNQLELFVRMPQVHR